ncbi:hypothetical protein SNEBB_009479 [Seison nebaliae]|nr:hypothetical protein SNEBB_009479 [Seison nebaliae]
MFVTILFGDDESVHLNADCLCSNFIHILKKVYLKYLVDHPNEKDQLKNNSMKNLISDQSTSNLNNEGVNQLHAGVAGKRGARRTKKEKTPIESQGNLSNLAIQSTVSINLNNDNNRMFEDTYLIGNHSGDETDSDSSISDTVTKMKEINNEMNDITLDFCTIDGSPKNVNLILYQEQHRLFLEQQEKLQQQQQLESNNSSNSDNNNNSSSLSINNENKSKGTTTPASLRTNGRASSRRRDDDRHPNHNITLEHIEKYKELNIKKYMSDLVEDREILILLSANFSIANDQVVAEYKPLIINEKLLTEDFVRNLSTNVLDKKGKKPRKNGTINDKKSSTKSNDAPNTNTLNKKHKTSKIT